jgi:hypothetical protein
VYRIAAPRAEIVTKYQHAAYPKTRGNGSIIAYYSHSQ